MELFERIRKHRRALDMTQKDMAQILNVHRATYGEYELGKNQPPIDKLVKIADALKVSVDYLVGRENQKTLDIAETLDYVLKIVQNNEHPVNFENNPITKTTSKLLASSIEHAMAVAKISIKDDENEQNSNLS